MPTLEEIGKATKAKYPQYAGKSDAEVGQAVVNKYPEYKSRLTSSDTRSGAQKVADFFGLGTTLKNIKTIGNFGVGPSDLGSDYVHIGKSQDKRTNEFAKLSEDAFKQSQELIKKAKEAKDPAQKKALLDQSRSIMADVVTKGEAFTSDLSKRQLDSGISEKDLGRSNLEFAARRGAGQTAELASYVVPGMVGGPTASIGQRVLQAAGKGAVAGGLQGAAGAAGESENILDALGRVASGSVVGAGTGAILQGVLETPQVAKEWWNKTAKNLGTKAKEVYASTLKENIADKKFFKQAGGIDKVIDEASAMKLPNTKSGMTKYLEEYGPEFERTVSEQINKSTNKSKTINLDSVVAKAKQMIKKQYGADQTIIDSADNWFKTNQKIYSGKTSLNGSNNLRKGLDRTVGSQLAQDINQGATAAKKAIATVLRDEFKTLVPELKPAIRKYQIVSGLANAMKKEPITGLAEFATAGTGAALGSIYGGPAAILSALGGLGASTAIRSPGLKRSITSGIMNEARRAAPTVVKSAINAAPVINPAVAALQRMIDKETQSKQTKTKLP